MVGKVAICSPNSGLERWLLSLNINISISEKALIGPVLALVRPRSQAAPVVGGVDDIARRRGMGKPGGQTKQSSQYLQFLKAERAHAHVCRGLLGKPKSERAPQKAYRWDQNQAWSIHRNIIRYQSFGSTICQTPY